MSDVFEKTSAICEQHTGFTRIQSRGTIRLLVKEAGENPHTISKDDMVKLLRARLQAELKKRGVTDCDQLAPRIIGDVEGATFAGSAYDVFSKF